MLLVNLGYHSHHKLDKFLKSIQGVTPTPVVGNTYAFLVHIWMVAVFWDALRIHTTKSANKSKVNRNIACKHDLEKAHGAPSSYCAVIVSKQWKLMFCRKTKGEYLITMPFIARVSHGKYMYRTSLTFEWHLGPRKKAPQRPI